MIEQIRKRDGRLEKFQPEKITWAIFKAAQACGGSDFALASHLTDLVIADVAINGKSQLAEVEFIQDTIERVLIKRGHDRTAKAFILYREKRKGAREMNALIGATIDMFSGYLNDQDWRVKENANAQKSVQGLNNYVREFFTQNYWLHEVYPAEVREAYETGPSIFTIGVDGPLLRGWDLRQLLQEDSAGCGQGGKPPAKHLRAFLGQVVNSTFTTQGETAGAQAWSSIDTYCAPFIRYDQMTYAQVRQCCRNSSSTSTSPRASGSSARSRTSRST
jgi:ribonucleoside-triphosphate reductase